MSNPPFGQKSNTARHQSPVFCHRMLKILPSHSRWVFWWIYMDIVLLWNLLLSYHDHIQQSLVSRTGGNDRKWKPQKPSGNYRLLRNYKSTRIQRWPHFRQSTLLLWSLETETLRIHITQLLHKSKVFFAALGGKQHGFGFWRFSGGFHFKIPQSGSERVGCIFFCPSLVQWSFLADIWPRLRNINTILDIFAFAAQNRKAFPCWRESQYHFNSHLQ